MSTWGIQNIQENPKAIRKNNSRFLPLNGTNGVSVRLFIEKKLGRPWVRAGIAGQKALAPMGKAAVASIDNRFRRIAVADLRRDVLCSQPLNSVSENTKTDSVFAKSQNHKIAK